ncbi:DNA polymerase III subunit gamma/tau [Flavobacteriaceae bacterium]|nr:DNA polymerase III subunit gamma/tau [Flavobacteriaceae bacterium]
MEPFIVSARKYRPTTFKDVVGQKAITNTLENAIENNHLAQALLFTGPRGVGKTTCARILAKKINQDGSHKEDEDFAFNIFELDAASNNSVDDIRNLIDQVRIPPQVGQYKVYIIDEVHMLSSAAFNAFLKTLEEPPKHAIFILATTEKHKIIPTILSRCQIFDFRRITVQDIKGHLASVAQQENITAQDDALHVIAQKADGALRDALSIFDRVVSFSGENLTREAVTENLNVLDYTYYFNITDLVIQNDIPQVLLAYNEILSKGFDGHHFIMGLASHFRDLLVCKNQQTISLLEVGDQVKKMYLEQSQQTPHDFLIEALDIANSCDLKFKTSRNQRLLVELCLMQLSSLTAQGEKKKANKLNKRFVLPPSHFKEIAAQVQEKLDTTQKAPVIATPPIVQTNQTKEQEIQNPCSTQVDKQETLQQSPPIKEEVSSKKRVSALSLKSIQKKQQLTKEINARIPNQENLPTEDFTQQQMITHWNAYTEIVKGQGKYNFLSHLTMNEPKLKDGMIHLEFPNQTIKLEVERDKFELLSYMRKKLKNYNVDLVIDVNELQVKRYAYTDKEKYEKLVEKNPNLEALRNAFELDI